MSRSAGRGDRAELVTDDAAELRAQLQKATGERIGALEGIGEMKREAPDKAGEAARARDTGQETRHRRGRREGSRRREDAGKDAGTGGAGPRQGRHGPWIVTIWAGSIAPGGLVSPCSSTARTPARAMHGRCSKPPGRSARPRCGASMGDFSNGRLALVERRDPQIRHRAAPPAGPCAGQERSRHRARDRRRGPELPGAAGRVPAGQLRQRLHPARPAASGRRVRGLRVRRKQDAGGGSGRPAIASRPWERPGTGHANRASSISSSRIDERRRPERGRRRRERARERRTTTARPGASAFSESEWDEVRNAALAHDLPAAEFVRERILAFVRAPEGAVAPGVVPSMVPLIERMFRYTWFLATERRDAMLREGREAELEKLVGEAPRLPGIARAGRLRLSAIPVPRRRIRASRTKLA